MENHIVLSNPAQSLPSEPRTFAYRPARPSSRSAHPQRRKTDQPATQFGQLLERIPFAIFFIKPQR